jgi:23S rRNA (adenine2030-N6)-methyltransferase
MRAPAAWHHRGMLAYRHAFHAGNHADVLKHLIWVALLRHLNLKDKGWRAIDTHAGAGGYSLEGTYAQQRAEFAQGIGRLWARDDLPPLAADLRDLVRHFNADGALRQYPGSPALAHLLMRPQDQLRLFELHPTDHKILADWLGGEPGVQVRLADGFAGLKAQLPPPTRRGVVLIDPPYEIKTDYRRVLDAAREALARFPEGQVMVWMPQLQLLEASQLPQRLKASADAGARKGWLLARLSVSRGDERGFGLLGSSVFVANPPHTLAPALRSTLPWLAEALRGEAEPAWVVEAAGG